MKNYFEIILALLRCELWGEELKCSINADDMVEVMHLARDIQINGLVSDVIVRNELPVGEDAAMEAFGTKRRHEKKSVAMNVEVAKFALFLNKRDLPYMIMKGQTLAALYPHPLARSCGDIDFYCPPESYNKVQEMIENRLGIVMTHNLSEIHDNFDIEGFQFEMHSMLTRFSYGPHQRYWDNLTREILAREQTSVNINGCEVSTIPPELNMIFVFSHLLEHLVENGIGLKQLCDWTMVLHHYHHQVDAVVLEQHLKKLGILKAYRRMGAWVVQNLGLPEQEFPLTLTKKDYQWTERLTNNILYWVKKLRKQKKIRGGFSLQHSLRTASAVFEQSFRFFWLAPMEMLMRAPQMAVWSVKKRGME